MGNFTQQYINGMNSAIWNYTAKSLRKKVVDFFLTKVCHPPLTTAEAQIQGRDIQFDLPLSRRMVCTQLKKEGRRSCSRVQGRFARVLAIIQSDTGDV